MTAPSPAALVGPCIERIYQGATGRKYNKLRQDAKALLEKLDTLLVVQQAVPAAVAVDSGTPSASAGPPGTPRQQHAAEAGPASPAEDTAASGEPSTQGAAAVEEEEQVEVSLQTGDDGEVFFKLTLSPSKIAAAGAAAADGEAAAVHEADPGHMPVSSGGGSATRPAARRRSEALQPRPGALHDSAARELLCFLRDAVDTRKAPVMEVALDCIQKLISFRLLQGPVHHINHR